MNFIQKWAGLVALVILAISFALPLVHGPSLGSSAGQVHWTLEAFLQGLQIGQNGTKLANDVVTSCSMIANNSINATSTGYAYCTGVSGVVSGDFIATNFATSTAAITQSKDDWIILSAKASTTPGAIDFILYNGTGANAVPSAVGRMASTTIVHAAH